MVVLTCISDTEHLGYKLLKKSCDYYNLELKTLFHQSDWSSHRLKDSYVKTYLETLEPDEIILFTDGYDAMFVSSEKEILNKFYSFNRPVVFSAETNCYPYEGFKEQYGLGKTKFQYLNSGGYIGQASSLLKLYNKFDSIRSQKTVEMENYRWSNQFLWTMLYLGNREEICLDYNCSIFQTFVNRIDIFPLDPSQKTGVIHKEVNRVLNDFYIENDRLYNKVTASCPIHLHFNGLLFKNILNTGILNELLPWED